MPLLHHCSVLVSAAWVARSHDDDVRPTSALRRTRAMRVAHTGTSVARTRKSAGRKVYTPCELRQWDFDSRAIAEPADQIVHLRVMLEHLGAQSVLGISSHECTALLTSIQDGYARTADAHFTRSYHNFHHAFDVTQTLFALFGFAERTELLTALERVVLLLAAVGHDIAHPGVSNRFLVATKHPLALAYGYASVLENMHAAKTMALIERHNVLCNLTSDQKIVAQHLLVTSILGTDVAQHDRHLHSVREIVASEAEASPVRPRHHGIHSRVRIGSFLLHCADISNATKPFHIAEQWADLIMKEFFEQGEAEKRLGLPVSPHCDADTTNVPDLQIQFITFAILPTFALLAQLLPSAHVAVQQAHANLSEWERKKAQSSATPFAPGCDHNDDANSDANHTQHPRDAVRTLVSHHASAYWQTVVALLRSVGWTCAVLCVPLVNYMLGRTGASTTSGTASGASGVLPSCIFAAVVLHLLLGGDSKSSVSS